MSSELVDWAQCELCKKWRKLPVGMNPETLPDEWICSMNTWDTLYSSCNALEEIVANPTESIQPFVSEQVKLSSEFHNRTLKGRKKSSNSFTNVNTNNQNLNSKASNVLNSSFLEDSSKNSNNFSLNTFFSKGLVDELNEWTNKLERKDECNSHDFFLGSEEELPSSWPSEYINIDSIFLVRNKLFEQIEKTRIKTNQSSAKNDLLINSGIIQNYPICIFRSRMPTLQAHPLYGRTLITGTEIPVIFQTLNSCINGIFPAFFKDHIPKNSNNQLNLNSCFSNAPFKNQSSISTNNSISLEFIPAVKSDWNLPFLNLSNSLFVDNDDSSKHFDQIEIWNSCVFSYKKLFPFDGCFQIVPDYIKLTNDIGFNERTTNSTIDYIDEYLNVDVLDLFPLFSWLENSFNGIHSAYPRSSQCSIVNIHSHKTVKKHMNKANARTKTKLLEHDQFDRTKIRRSSRNIVPKIQLQEKFTSNIKNEVEFTNCESNKLSVNESNESSNIYLDQDTQSIDDTLNQKYNTIRKINDDELHEIKKGEETNTLTSVFLSNNNSLLNIQTDDLSLTSFPLQNDSKVELTNKEKFFHSNNSSIAEEYNNNLSPIVAQNSEKRNIEIDFKPPDISGNIKNQINFSEKKDLVQNEQILDNFSDDEDFNLPTLGSHKRRKNLMELNKLNDLSSAKVDEIDTVTTSKKRLKRKIRISDMNLFYSDNEEVTCNYNINSESKESEIYNDNNLLKQSELNINTDKDEIVDRQNRKPSTLQIIPRKKSFESPDRPALLFSPKGDPWIPISDSTTVKRDLQIDEVPHQQIHKIKNSNWQIDQKRQRSVEQKRPLYLNSSGHRSYYQNKHRNQNNYESHDKSHSKYRIYNSSDLQNPHSINSTKNPPYYNCNANLMGQTTQVGLRSEGSYSSHNYRSYHHSKYSANNSSTNINGSVNRHYRPRVNEH